MPPSPIFFFFFLFALGAVDVSAQSQAGSTNRQLWCVAKNNAEDSSLQSSLDWACGAGGANCGPIQNGGPCYDPNDQQRTASFAFNDYYIKNGPSDSACDFGNTAALTSLDPSFGHCRFPSTSSGGGNGNINGLVDSSSDSESLSSSSNTLTTYHLNMLLTMVLYFSSDLMM